MRSSANSRPEVCSKVCTNASCGPNIVPIPGTRSAAHLAEDLGAARVTLSPDAMRRLDVLINPRTVVGPRYDAAAQADIDTEDFPAL